jgi:hypothetical protein
VGFLRAKFDCCAFAPLYCTTDGRGGYIFMNRMLLEYFASLEENSSAAVPAGEREEE